MRKIYFAVLISITIFTAGFSVPDGAISVSYQPNVDRLDRIFRESLPLDKKDIFFTKVPRGLIVSINEKIFFNESEVKIKESSLPVIDTIIMLLEKLNNYCVIENHTEENSFDNKNLELSLQRSSNIAEYMITCGKISASRIFALCYGQYMPFRDNVSAKKDGLNNRVDFVILEYEARR